MKRALLRAAKTIAASAGAAVLAACAFAIWVAGTEDGLQFVWQRVAPRLPDGIEVAAIEGRLAGPLSLRGVSLRTPTLEAHIEQVELEWLASALPGLLRVQRLHVRGVDVLQIPAATAAPQEPDGSSPLPERIELPFTVDVDDASVEDIRYRASPDAEPLLIDRVALAGRLDDNELLVRELSVRAPLLDATARARIVPHDRYGIGGELEWVLRYAGYPDASGTVRFSGDLDALALEPRIGAPYNASAQVEVRQPLAAPSFAGTVKASIQPAELGIELPAGTIDAEVALEGTPADVGLTGTVQLGGKALDELEARLRARFVGGALEVERLDVAHPPSAATLQASGTVSFAPELALDVHGSWSGLQWPLRDPPLARSASGTLELRGTPDEYALSFDAAVASPQRAEGRVRAAGTGNLQALTLEHVEVDALGGRIDGRGDFTWQPAIGASLALTGRDLDPRLLASDWPGRLGVTVRAAATVAEQDVAIRVDELTVAGELRGRAVEASARGEYSRDTVRLDSLSARSGETRVEAQGSGGRDVALQWRIDSPDLADVWPGLAGRLEASGALNGPRLQPQVRVDARGKGLRVMGSEAGELSVAADVDLAGKAQSRLDVSLRELDVQGTPLEQLELHGTGNAARHDLQVAAKNDVGEAQLDLAGSLEQPWRRDFAWTFELGTATFANATLPPWQLREPASGRVSAARAELARTCWQSGAAELCIDAARSPDRTEAHFAVSQLPFAYFAAALVEPVQIEGELRAEGSFAQRSGVSPQVNVRLESSLGRIVAADPGAAEPYALAFGPLEGRVTTENDRVAGKLTVPLEQRGALELEAQIGAGGGAPFAERSLDGALRLDVEELDFLSRVLADLQDTGGALGGEMRLSGTVGDPRIDGRIALDNGRATLRATNVVLEDLRLVATSDGSGAITIDAGGRSGGGSVRAAGTFAFADGGARGRITVRGQDFEVIDTQDAQVLVSPDLTFAVAPDQLELTGVVTVPKARLTPRESGPSAINASADQIIVTEESEQGRGRARPLRADVELRLGDEVNVRGYGLEGRLGGGIKIVEVPGEPITGSGELRVDEGTYEAYGQKLDVERGRVLFAGGPIEQPGLDVEAVRRPVEGILVGARVRGTLKSPQLTVFSQPTMPQQEQLSYLVLGRPLESASESESSAMSRAALALGLKGGNFVSERINKNLGLDDFGIQTDPNQAASEASFVIGKYLSPSLYVSYGIGLFEPVNTLRLRYTITRRWQLVTESSSKESGGDVIYNIERK